MASMGGWDAASAVEAAPGENLDRSYLRAQDKPSTGHRKLAILSVCSNSNYPTIAAGLAAANSGDTLELCAETFQEAVIVAGMDITITGQGKGKTIIKAPYNTKTLVEARTNTNVKLEKVTLDGNNNMAQDTGPPGAPTPIFAFSCIECYAEVKNVEMKKINTFSGGVAAPSYGVFARSRAAGAGHSIKVVSTDIKLTTSTAVHVDGAGLTGVIVRNSLTGALPALYPSSGVQVSRGASAIVQSNTVKNFKAYDPTKFGASGVATVCPGPGTKIQYNDLRNNDRGVTLISSSEVVVLNNDVSSNTGGIYVELQKTTGSCEKNEATDNEVKKNSISGSTDAGIRLAKIGGATGAFRNTLIEQNDIQGSGANGIEVGTGQNHQFTANTITDCSDSCVKVSGGKNFLLELNDITTCTNGIWVSGGNKHNVRSNEISDCDEFGILVTGGNTCTFDSNTITNGGAGIGNMGGTGHVFN